MWYGVVFWCRYTPYNGAMPTGGCEYPRAQPRFSFVNDVGDWRIIGAVHRADGE
jgi:hypothetical protein